ncbi:MAG: hypothetical protein ABSD74_15295 [Rhizomicrobium sp.]
MRRLLVVLACLAVATPVCALGGSPPHIKCSTGPLTKTYGGTKWLVYSCGDHTSLALIAAPGNPGAPFTFTFVHGSTGYDLYGEGKGNRQATDAAYAQLTKLSGDDVRALIAATQRH